jgi:hypothetical protein
MAEVAIGDVMLTSVSGDEPRFTTVKYPAASEVVGGANAKAP